jgi:hypothetical protein
MSEDDISYFHHRAGEEIERASAATDPRSVAFHYLLANLYLDRVFPEGQPGDGTRSEGACAS